MFLRDETIAKLSVDLPEADRFSAVERALGVPAATTHEALVSQSLKLITPRREMAEREYTTVRERVVSMTAELARIRESSISEQSSAAAILALRAELKVSDTVPLDPKSLESQMSAIRTRAKIVERAYHELDDAIRHRADLDRQLNTSQTLAEKAELVAVDAELLISQTRLNALDAAIATAGSRLEERRAFAQLATAGAKIGTINGRCPLCASAVSSDQFEHEIQRVMEAAGEQSRHYEETVAAREQEITRLGELRSKRRRLAELLEAIESAAARAQAELDRLRQQLMKLTGLKEVSPDSTRSWLSGQAASINRMEEAVGVLVMARLMSQAGEAELELAAAKREADSLATGVAKLRAGEDDLKELLRTVKQVSKEIVDERLAAATPLLTELYRRLRPHAGWRDVSYTIRGEIRKFLSFRVGDAINPKFVFSSGQRRAAGLAFLLAVHLARNWCLLNTLVLDDPVQHIDDFRALHLVEVLSAIRKTGRQMICSVEDSALADLLVRRLQVEPLTGGSRVELRHDPVRGVLIESDRKVFALPQNVLRTA